jgi:hypothetical protein
MRSIDEILKFANVFFKLAARQRYTLEEAYTILGVTPPISDEDLKKTYRRKSFENHPDRNPHIPPDEINRKMVAINVAYECAVYHRAHPEPTTRPAGGREGYQRRSDPESPWWETPRSGYDSDAPGNNPRPPSTSSSFEAASFGAGIGVSSGIEWYFITKPIIYNRTSALVVIGKDDTYLYTVGIYHKYDPPNIGNSEGTNLWKMDMFYCDINPKDRLPERLTRYIKTAYNSVVSGDNDIKRIGRITLYNSAKEWTPFIMFAQGRTVTLSDALTKMNVASNWSSTSTRDRRVPRKIKVLIKCPLPNMYGDIVENAVITINSIREYQLSIATTRLLADRAFISLLGLGSVYGSYTKDVTGIRDKTKVKQILILLGTLLGRHSEDNELIQSILRAYQQVEYV